MYQFLGTRLLLAILIGSATLMACDGPEVGAFTLTWENKTDSTLVVSIAKLLPDEVPPQSTLKISYIYGDWDAPVEILAHTPDDGLFFED